MQTELADAIFSSNENEIWKQSVSFNIDNGYLVQTSPNEFIDEGYLELNLSHPVVEGNTSVNVTVTTKVREVTMLLHKIFTIAAHKLTSKIFELQCFRETLSVNNNC